MLRLALEEAAPWHPRYGRGIAGRAAHNPVRPAEANHVVYAVLGIVEVDDGFLQGLQNHGLPFLALLVQF